MNVNKLVGPTLRAETIIIWNIFNNEKTIVALLNILSK